MFKKWKEKVRSELKKEIDDFKDLAVKMYHKEIDTVGKRFLEFEKKIIDNCNSAIDLINRSKNEWNEFIQKQESRDIQRNQAILEDNVRHVREIERGLKMCEESLEIIKKHTKGTR